MRNLLEIRDEIDQLDQRIIETILRRIELSHEIKKIKELQGKEIYDPVREKEVVDGLKSKVENNHHDYIEKLYQLIFSYSRELQEK